MTSFKFNSNNLYYIKEILVSVHTMDSTYHVPLYTHTTKIESVYPIYDTTLDKKTITLLVVQTTDAELEIHIDSCKDIVLSNFFQLVHDDRKANDTKNVELVMEVDAYLHPDAFETFLKTHKVVPLKTSELYTLKKLVIDK